MTKKKKLQNSVESIANTDSAPVPHSLLPKTLPALSPQNAPITPKKATDVAVGSSLTISRNKHWRYISAFHGHWLQLPHEILESLAHNNYLSPRPRQTHPAVLYDLLKIRRLVDEASNLAVRAQNGTASSALNNSRDDGLPGGSLGLSYRGGGNAKLSPERKFRMRELATQKLSQAYRIDEIAASVATMQSASTLDNVASFVLQRNPTAVDGKYVHFFHEKIPSRMMAECTPLTPLDEVIRAEPGNPAPYRTRASTKIFKEDYNGAIQDLTEALALCRVQNAKHRAGRNQLVTMQTIREEAEKRKTWTKDWMQENRVAEEDQPSSLEMQLLFQRGNQYLTVACQNIRVALDFLKEAGPHSNGSSKETSLKAHGDCQDHSHSFLDTYRLGIEARETVRKNAKRAFRDYTAFFSHIDYGHVQVFPGNEDLFRQNDVTFMSNNGRSNLHSTRLLDEPVELVDVNQNTSTVVRRECSRSPSDVSYSNGYATPPKPSIYALSDLLSATPPSDLPPFSPTTQSSTHRELATYHPLLPETLHCFLLTHCLLQTPLKTLARIAHNVARIVRLADGYQFFQSARSPARADWSEILRKTEGQWNIELGGDTTLSAGSGIVRSWETLCKAAQPVGAEKDKESKMARTSNGLIAKMSSQKGEVRTSKNPSSAVNTITNTSSTVAISKAELERKETQAERKDRIHKECVIEALGDERVVDDDTFQRAVKAREQRAWSDIAVEEKALKIGFTTSLSNPVSPNNSENTFNNNEDAKTKLATNGKDASAYVPRDRRVGAAKDEAYLIGTERAELIARWILEAPAIGEGLGMSKKRKGKASGKKIDVHTQELVELEADMHEA